MECLVLLLLKGPGSRGPIALRRLKESHAMNSRYGCSLKSYNDMDIICTSAEEVEDQKIEINRKCDMTR